MGIDDRFGNGGAQPGAFAFSEGDKGLGKMLPDRFGDAGTVIRDDQFDVVALRLRAGPADFTGGAIFLLSGKDDVTFEDKIDRIRLR
jgi:hypothetical protein